MTLYKPRRCPWCQELVNPVGIYAPDVYAHCEVIWYVHHGLIYKARNVAPYEITELIERTNRKPQLCPL